MEAEGQAAPHGEGRVVLVTPRLVLRTFRPSDLAPFAALNADPRVMAFLGGTLDRAASDAIALGADRSFRDERFGKIAVARRSDGAFLGACGLSRERWYPDDLEIGWRLDHRHWGQGYATEAARAWLAYAFEVLGCARVISISDVPNRRCIAVMERIGLSFDHAATLSDGGVPFDAVVYASRPGPVTT
jgi:RimJ/RimL family protein N-acetyltransferase